MTRLFPLALIVVILDLMPALSPTAAAQSVLFTAGGGYTKQYRSPGVSATGRIGVGYEYEFNQHLTLCPTIGITNVGWRVPNALTPDMLFDADGNMLTSDGTITTDPAQQGQRVMTDAEGNPIFDGTQPVYYVSPMHRSYDMTLLRAELPFYYYLRTAPFQYVIFGAGPFVDYALSGKRATKGDGREPGSRKVGYADNILSLNGSCTFNVGLKASLGYQLPQGVAIGLECDFRLLRNNDITVRDAAGRPDVLADPFGGRAGRSVSMMFTLCYKLNRKVWKGEE